MGGSVPTTCLIVVVTVLVWMVPTLGPSSARTLELWFASSSTSVFELRWLGQLVIPNLTHEGGLHLTVNMFFVLWLGPPVERRIGSLRYALFYLSAGVFAYASYAAGTSVNLLPNWGQTVGASGCVMATATLYALIFHQESIDLYGIVPVPVWWVVFLFLVSDASSLVWRDGIPGINNAVHLSGALFGAACWLFWCRDSTE